MSRRLLSAAICAALAAHAALEQLRHQPGRHAGAAEGTLVGIQRLGIELLLVPQPVFIGIAAGGIGRGVVVPQEHAVAVVGAPFVLAIVVEGRQARLDRIEDFERVVAALKPGQQVTLLVGRGESASYVSLRADK